MHKSGCSPSFELVMGTWERVPHLPILMNSIWEAGELTTVGTIKYDGILASPSAVALSLRKVIKP